MGKGASRTKRKACQTVNDTNESTPSAQSQEKRLRLDDSGSSLVSVLPAEIWFQIFSLLPSRRLLETVGCVNHEWYHPPPLYLLVNFFVNLVGVSNDYSSSGT